jgi:hypothetical protein
VVGYLQAAVHRLDKLPSCPGQAGAAPLSKVSDGEASGASGAVDPTKNYTDTGLLNRCKGEFGGRKCLQALPEPTAPVFAAAEPSPGTQQLLQPLSSRK